ncbi:MAG: site-2 protease family protein [Tatlockia sp.]|nr:site-2 protease family protein [Tatlockia sp.]
MFMALLAFVLTMILVVGIHEAGHALSAKLFKVKIRRISIGFGKALLTWKDKAGREWVWALWPLGGYVQLLNSRIEDLPQSDYSQCFDKKPIWQRCIILLSGSLANLLTAFLALSFMYMLGFQQQIPLIKEITPQSIASQASLQAGDRFVAIDGQKTNSWQEVGMSFIMALGKAKVPILVANRDGIAHQTNLDLSQWRYQKKERSLFVSLGINPASAKLNTKRIPGQSFFPALNAAILKILFLLKFFLIMLKQLITQKIPFAVLLGPLGLFETSIYSFLQGLAVFLYFIASFSLAVGVVNLLPFPGLDGGSLIYTIVEKFRGKPVSVALELLLHRLAFIFFFFLLFHLLMNDLQRYLSS